MPLDPYGARSGVDAAKQERRNYYRNNPNTFGNAPAVFDAFLGEYVDTRHGGTYTGPLVGNGGATVGYAVNGQYSANPPSTTGTSGAAGDRPPDFPKLVTTVQQPEVANIARSGLAALPKQSEKTLTSFDDLLSQQKQDIGSFRTSAPKVYDSSATEAELRGANQRFETGSQDVLGKLEQRNAEYEAAQKANQAAKQAELKTYEAASQAVADRAVDRAERAMKASMVSAGPDVSSGWSGNLANRYARTYADINVPLQRELSGLRTGLISEGMGLEREYQANDNARLQFNQALNEAFRGNTVQIAQYLQNLRTALRTANVQEAMQLLGREADMLGLGQRLRSGEISMAQLLQALERSAVDFTYYQPFDASRIAPTASYTPGLPTRSYTPRLTPEAIPALTGNTRAPVGGYQPAGTPGGGFRPLSETERGYVTAEPWRYTRQYVQTSPLTEAPRHGLGYVNGTWIGEGADILNQEGYVPAGTQL